MLTILILVVLFSLVITGGVLTLLKGLQKPPGVLMGEQACVNQLAAVHKQNTYVGGSLIGVGVLGLLMVVYMGYNEYGSGGEAVSNFGFKFY